MFNGIALVMKYQSEYVIRRMRLICSEIAWFIDKNAQCLHMSSQKMAGNIPAEGGPGSCDQPVPYVILYHVFKKSQYLLLTLRAILLYANAVDNILRSELRQQLPAWTIIRLFFCTKKRCQNCAVCLLKKGKTWYIIKVQHRTNVRCCGQTAALCPHWMRNGSLSAKKCREHLFSTDGQQDSQ